MKQLQPLLLLLVLFFNIPVFAQLQLGFDIEGEAAADKSGISVDISEDGTRAIVGAIFNENAAGGSGQARVYNWNGSQWVQLGNDIDGEADGDSFGSSVSISAAGNRVAIGAPFNDNNGTSAGQVKVYTLQGGDWVQLGATILGQATGDRCGSAVTLSDNGNRLAVSAPSSSSGEYESGQVRIYQLNGANNWVPLGGQITGEVLSDESGESLSFSSGGSRIAIGAIYNAGSFYNAGHVRVFQYNGSNWSQVGADIDGENTYDLSGKSVSLSNDGNRIAIGAHANTNENYSTAGHVRVFDYDGSNWTQVGTDMEGSNGGGPRFGWSLSLSGDGTRVAVGGFLANFGDEQSIGNCQIYDFDGTDWSQVYSNIYGEAAGDNSAISVALSEDGNRIIIGAPNNSDNGEESGHARVFDLPNCPPSNTDTTILFVDACESFEWIDGNTYFSSTTSASFTFPNVIGCDSVILLNLTVHESSQTTLTESTCDAFILNGETYNVSGTYEQTLTNTIGCDSLITLNLTVDENTNSTLTASSCGEFDLNGEIYTSSGTFMQTIPNSVGCDSLITLELSVTDVNVVVTEMVDHLIATANDATYQWIDCDTQGEIEGANEQTFFPETSGNYAVQVTQNGCTETSICFDIVLIYTRENSFPIAISVYPNPVHGKAFIDLGEEVFPHLSVELINTNGQVVLRKKLEHSGSFALDLSNYVDGVYMLKIRTAAYQAVLPIVVSETVD